MKQDKQRKSSIYGQAKKTKLTHDYNTTSRIENQQRD